VARKKEKTKGKAVARKKEKRAPARRKPAETSVFQRVVGKAISAYNEAVRRREARQRPPRRVLKGKVKPLRLSAPLGRKEYDFKKFGPLFSFDGVEGHEEIERYWIEKPFTLAVILINKDTNEYLYHLVEPKLPPPEQRLLEKVRDDLMTSLPYEMPTDKKDEVLTKKFFGILREHGITSPIVAYRTLYYLKRDNTGYNKIDAMLKDEAVEDISCDGVDVPVFLYHRKYYNIRTNVKFSNDELNLFTIRLAERCGKHISLSKPLIDATLPDGSRAQMTLGSEVTTKGSSFSIRRFLGRFITPVDLIKFNTFSPEMLAYLWMAIENRKSVLILGGTASGKTSTLNALAFFVPPSAKIVSIEDTRELSLYQENWIPSLTREAPGEAKINMYDLLRQALRQRPECIIVGESRGEEALTMFQAMSTGHAVYSTMHAGTMQEAINRLEGEPINLPHQMLSSLDIVCIQLLTYLGKERVRRNESITEIVGVSLTSEEVTIKRLFEWNPGKDSFGMLGDSHVLTEIMNERGWSWDKVTKEMENKEKILRYAVKNNIASPKDLASLINMYYYNPDKVLKSIR
jgi:flagellar protein FlaI